MNAQHRKMTELIWISVLLLVASIAGCAEGGKAKGTSPAQSQVDTLVAILERDEIGKVEIFNIPASVKTFAAITPEELEKNYHCKLTIRDIRFGANRPKLIEAVKSVSVWPRSNMGDIRWGIVFYGINEARVAGLYFDKWGNRGAVDSTPVSFNGGLFRWLDRNFSRSFR